LPPEDSPTPTPALESRKYFLDILKAGDLTSQFLTDRTLVQYQNDPFLRSAVELQLETIGEAVSQQAQTRQRPRRADPRSSPADRFSLSSWFTAMPTSTICWSGVWCNPSYRSC
jgi:hypothetical protein